ncbi:EamA family transporter [Actinobacteria bacterium YIM 96077]|uniref:EamA family transporter n=1 Tax=Phytoactinopolyspora halophila TaxID=1981511 RepID=A0A329QGL8_9ACTN|nr:EamA family transporter [Phytoactinopolyspora halophila]AYY14447.1 EamA family transporter [Actinobacteria bacterium YIM 96077]RAW11440.1 EamA family transporter [Phytoactinopolyspora halophila]
MISRLRSSTRLAAAAAAGTVVLWASAFVVIRDVGHTFSPGSMALIRLFVAAVALTALALVTYRSTAFTRVPRRSLPLVVACGVLWLAGYTVALNAAEQHIDAGTAAFLVNLAPLLIAFGAGTFLGEGYPRPLIVGSLVALGGLGMIAMGSSGHRDGIGVALCLLAALLYTAGMLIQKVALRRVDALPTIWLGSVAGTTVLTPWAPQLIGEFEAASAGAVLGAVYLGVFPTAVGFTLWAYALSRMNAGRLSATTYAVPPVAVLLSWLFLAEMPTVYGLIGGVVCLAGVAFSRRSGGARARTRHRPRAEAAGAEGVPSSTGR